MFGNLNKREQQIIELLAEDSTCSIQMISEKLKVSQVTIRSDLTTLESKGVLIRTRGGALPVYHPAILEHQKRNITAKQRIARAAAELVSDGDNIMINDGTTTSLIAKYLLGKRGIHLVTNSTLLLTYSRVNPSLHTTLVGGEFRAASEAIVGSQALKQLRMFHVRHVFVGTEGFSLEKGLTTYLQESAEIVRTMTELGDNIILLADSSKLNQNGFVKILPVENIDILISDRGLDGSTQKELEKRNIKVILAD